MEKIIKTDVIFQKQDDHNPIKFGEINTELLPDDVIIAGHDEGHYSENNSWEPHYYLEIHRNRRETDEEFEKRKEETNWLRKDMRKRRYENYLKLKKEFE